MKSVSRYENMKPNPVHAGYSDIRLWPCYMLFSATVLFFAPFLTIFGSFLLFGYLASGIAKMVYKVQTARALSYLEQEPQTDESEPKAKLHLALDSY